MKMGPTDSEWHHDSFFFFFCSWNKQNNCCLDHKTHHKSLLKSLTYKATLLQIFLYIGRKSSDYLESGFKVFWKAFCYDGSFPTQTLGSNPTCYVFNFYTFLPWQVSADTCNTHHSMLKIGVWTLKEPNAPLDHHPLSIIISHIRSNTSVCIDSNGCCLLHQGNNETLRWSICTTVNFCMKSSRIQVWNLETFKPIRVNSNPAWDKSNLQCFFLTCTFWI